MKFTRIITIMAVSSLLLSCSSFNQLLKSKDTQKKYTEALRYYYQKDYKRSLTLFENINTDMLGSIQADTIIFYSGKAYYNTRDYSLSAEMMDIYRKEFGRMAFVEEAEYLLGMSYYKMSAPPERDQSNTHKAITAFNEYLNRYPASIQAADIKLQIEELQEKLYLKEFINSSLYFKLGYYPAAVTALRASLKKDPDTPYREEMLYLICKSWYNYAKNSIEARKLDRYMKMVDSYYNFVSEYPESNQFIKELDKMFTYSRDYVEQNKDATMILEKNRIGIGTLKDQIKLDKAKLLDPTTDKAQKQEIKAKIKVDRASLKEEEAKVKTESKSLKKTDTNKKDNKKTDDEKASIKKIKERTSEQDMKTSKAQRASKEQLQQDKAESRKARKNGAQ